MAESCPKAHHAHLSFWFGLAWWALVALIYGWLLLLTTDEWAGFAAGFFLLLGWGVTGFPVVVCWLVSLLSRESSKSGWYLAWIGLLMGLSGPAHFLVLCYLH